MRHNVLTDDVNQIFQRRDASDICYNTTMRNAVRVQGTVFRTNHGDSGLLEILEIALSAYTVLRYN